MFLYYIFTTKEKQLWSCCVCYYGFEHSTQRRNVFTVCSIWAGSTPLSVFMQLLGMFTKHGVRLQDRAKGWAEFSMILLLVVKSSVVSLLLLPQRPEKQTGFNVRQRVSQQSEDSIVLQDENLRWETCCLQVELRRAQLQGTPELGLSDQRRCGPERTLRTPSKPGHVLRRT